MPMDSACLTEASLNASFRITPDFGKSAGEGAVAVENKRLLSSMPELCSSRSVC